MTNATRRRGRAAAASDAPATGAFRRRGRPDPAARPAGAAPSRRVRPAENAIAYAFLAAALVCFAVFSWFPIVRGVLLSFQRENFVAPPTWVGLDNFQRVIGDPLFVTAWANTGYFTILALIFGFAVPFAVAVLLNEIRHARGYFRLLVYLPVMLPPIVTALLWRWFYDPGPGLFNETLRALNLPTLEWLNSGDTAMFSLVLVSTWGNMGTATLIYLAALQNIPGELYEAAELDGAGVWQRIRHVTVPQTRFVLLALLLLQIVATMQVFTEPYIMTAGGPENATVTVLLLLYRYAFVYSDFGAASALSLMLFVALGAFSALYLRITRSTG
ncbi:carbohydrate ABC transporter permease [Allonocardiopsis opalescens]|uniref:Carbohydrate ABC transporter membrane protein 1 (CUT1 family) n=1 Tax=Allonocardiopsis opalescens TaxID=1144618 RepID=A0A2T0QEB0_9ACTN|nr:sugar ABC transporter permease [Allonocardiopsis opalescens]PRY02232.1 carbohydrate ABC transporter membrane protein 1 (CUT1 family) [Allonocardiopsis opalescens]